MASLNGSDPASPSEEIRPYREGRKLRENHVWTTHREFEAMITWAENKRNFAIIEQKKPKGGEVTPGLKQVPKVQGYIRLAEFVNRTASPSFKWEAEHAGRRWLSYKKKYLETRTKSQQSGFGLEPKDRKKGIRTVREKLEAMCPFYWRVHALLAFADAETPQKGDSSAGLEADGAAEFGRGREDVAVSSGEDGRMGEEQNEDFNGDGEGGQIVLSKRRGSALGAGSDSSDENLGERKERLLRSSRKRGRRSEPVPALDDEYETDYLKGRPGRRLYGSTDPFEEQLALRRERERELAFREKQLAVDRELRRRELEVKEKDISAKERIEALKIKEQSLVEREKNVLEFLLGLVRSGQISLAQVSSFKTELLQQAEDEVKKQQEQVSQADQQALAPVPTELPIVPL